MNSMEKIKQFINDRNWGQYHNEKDLALSITLEASELLELFQWKTAEEGRKDTERLKEELADVIIYSYQMADKLGFDVDEIIAEKLVKNAEKYPIEKVLAENAKNQE
ncbi:nucleotide pyrophosphohydrolase [Enterococcus timonensis]|uniref:nucleotide pyrophosphohydrolase n=1 Tax=Enterococcus timonensis TaxID=1852364 RepID=UPI0008D93D28|nr:nucleotide pyrophosphohydrolase [Enterococcus timonensis]